MVAQKNQELAALKDQVDKAHKELSELQAQIEARKTTSPAPQPENQPK